MKKISKIKSYLNKKNILILCLLNIFQSYSQVVLNANGPGNTYEEITAILAPGKNPIEVPDCNHNSFGKHIDEVFDTELNTYAFRFYIHVNPDNDRCKYFDRQRNEIKAYDKSPDNILGTKNEIVRYKWKFKLSEDFKVSSNFTHIHQLKSVGGSLASMPMYTITLRKSNPDRLELRFAETNRQITLKQTNLAPFKGVWLEVEETITYGENGNYSITITRISDNIVLFNYSNESIVNWRVGAEFVRPKWGMYRSLINKQDLRDEEVLFANFSIEELNSLSNSNYELLKKNINIIPNPAKNQITITEKVVGSYTSFIVFNQLGQKVFQNNLKKKTINVSHLPKGVYTIVFKNNDTNIFTKKIILN